MKKKYLFTAVILLSMFSSIMMQAQVSKTVNISIAGTLATSLNASERATITDLNITGTIDARDFKTMRDDMPVLASIDISAVSIAAYTGTEGTYNTSIISYPVNEVPDLAFFMCNNIISIVLPVSAISIGSTAFRECTSLASITIPVLVTHIGESAFSMCTGLTSVTISEGLTFIGTYAFWMCSSLTSITFPASVTTIEEKAIGRCTALIAVDGANQNYSSFEGVLFNKDKTTILQCPVSKTGIYTIPGTVTNIAVSAFTYCRDLISIIIPNTVTIIGDRPFSYCTSLTSITIPATVTSIGRMAFQECNSLSSIYANPLLPVDLSSSTTTSVFIGINKSTCTLYVPTGSKQYYEVANQWMDFTNIVEETVTVLNDQSAIEPKIYSCNNTLYIENADDNSSVKVYDITGRIHYSGKLQNSSFNVILNKSAIYIVKINDKSFKVVL